MSTDATTNGSTSAPAAGWLPQLHELFDARYALAQMEIRHDIASARRLGIVAGVGALLVLTSLPLLLFVLSESLAAWTQTDAFWWQLALGAGLLVFGGLLIFAGWLRFRREFTGLRETLDELREDRVWLNEMSANIVGRFGTAPPSSESTT